MYTKSVFPASSILAFATSAGLLVGCDSSGLVHGTALVDSRGQTLSIKAAVGIKGTYVTNTCLDVAGTGGAKRMGGVPWSAPFGTNPGAPTVVLNDASCQLNITQMDVLDSANQPASALAASPVGLAAVYGAPVLFSFTDSGTGNVSNFYANANITPADFSANFHIDVVYSDTQAALSPILLNGTYATVTANTITATSVPAPTYNLSFAAVSYMRDGLGFVSSTMGAPALSLINQTGQGYVITPGTCPTTLPTVAAAYTNPVAIATMPTTMNFGLVSGLSLASPVKRCLIAANCNNSAVCSYQLFQVTFN